MQTHEPNKSFGHGTPDDHKFEELILYVSRKLQGDSRFGSTKLNKVLFFCDIMAYRDLGKSITGQEYQKLNHGPAPRRLLPVRSKLLSNGSATIAVQEFFGKKQDRLVPLRDPDMRNFNGPEIALVNEVIDYIKDLTGKELSDFSHSYPYWSGLPLKQTIPLEVVFIPGGPITEVERNYASGLEARFAQ